MEDREVRFGLLLSETERDALARLAETTGGLSQAALIRHLIRAEAERRGLWPSEEGQQRPERRMRQ